MKEKNKPFVRLLASILTVLLCFAMLIPTLAEEPENSPEITSDPTWPKRSDGTTPAGTAADPYLIEDAADLLAFNAKRASISSSYTGKTILVTADIDLNPGWSAASGTVPTNVWKEFYNFFGTLDGGGHTIRGIYRSGNTYIGFMRNCSDMTIRNVTFDNCRLEATSGAVCGLLAVFKGSNTVDGVTLGSDFIVSGVSTVGGLIGCGFSGSVLHTVTNCKFLGQVTATGNYAGGLIGTTQGFSFALSNCYASGSVTSGGDFAGGLIGNIGKETPLTNCASAATVTAGNAAGGLIGRSGAKAILTDCSAAGTVTATGTAAGMIGLSAGVCDLTRCVSLATLNSTGSKSAALIAESGTEFTKKLTDCYAFSSPAVAFWVEDAPQTLSNLQIVYQGEPAAAVETPASVEALLQKTAFLPDGAGYYGWVNDNGLPLPAVINDLLHGHHFEMVETPSTCLEFGHRTYTCTTCGYHYDEPLTEKNDHTDSGEWIYDIEPTETTGGKRHRTCTVCHANFNYEYVPVPGTIYEKNDEWGKDGVYEIATPQDLLAFAAKRTAFSNYNGIRVTLTADIDLNPGWDPSIGLPPPNVLSYMFRFEGILDGQDHTISGLYSKGDPSGNNATFINILSNATVKNLKVTRSLFAGTGNYAGLFGTIVNTSTIENVYTDAVISANNYVGGICAWENNPTTAQNTVAIIRRCVFAGSVTGKQYVAGILSNNQSFDLEMTDCANYGTVTATVEQAAGLVARVNGKTTMTNCYNGGTVSETGGKSAELAVIVQLANTPEAPDNVKEILLQNCYVAAGRTLPALRVTEAGNGSKIRYGEEEATEIRSAASLAALVEAIPSWVVSRDESIAIPTALRCYVDGHRFHGTVTEPTCAQRGYTTYVCEDCGRVTLSDWVDPLPHTPSDEWIVDQEPTESRAGSRHRVCSVCGETLETEILPKKASQTTEPPAETNEPGETTAPVEKKKKGCRGAVEPSFLLLLFPAVLAVAATGKKRKQ